MKKTIALLCLNFPRKRVRRYMRNRDGKVFATHEAELGPIHDDSAREIEQFLSSPPDELRAA